MPAYFVRNVSDLYTTALDFCLHTDQAFPKHNTIWWISSRNFIIQIREKECIIVTTG